MTVNNAEECKGCTITDKTGVCLQESRNHMNCPCMKCLVKMICTDPCLEWKEFIGYNLSGK
jgi:hypothetical protein